MLTALLPLFFAAGGSERAFDKPSIDWLLSLGSVAEVSVNPKSQALLVEVDGFDNDKKRKQIYSLEAAGKAPQKIADGNAPAWAPDGKSFAYLADDKGVQQLFVQASGGSEPHRITHGKRAIEEFTWIDNTHFAAVFTKRIGCSQNCADEAESPEPPVVYVADDLLFRHWDSWTVGKRSVIAEVTLDGATKQLSEDSSDAPPFELQAPRNFDASPDGRYLAYGVAPSKNAAISNDLDIVLLDRQTGTRVKVSDSPGIDDQPRFSPDGKSIAYLSQARAGYESDRAVVWLYTLKTGKRIALSASLDRNISEIVWAADAKSLWLAAADDGGDSLYHATLDGKVERVLWAPSLELLAMSGKNPLLVTSTATNPGLLSTLKGKQTELVADFNHDIVLKNVPTSESIHFKARDGTPLQAWLTFPAGAKHGDKLKTFIMIHGGPQSAFTGGYSARWNAPLFASLGYLIVQPNPRGSTGFGQKFTEAVDHQFGGAPFRDVMDATDEVIKRGDADAAQMCAGGASYGGYMTNWIATQTDRFKCLISHAGLYDTTADYGTTEELWFDEWEMGKTPWENPQGYAEFSPSRFVDKIKTPMLITHGELDYRVFHSHALSLFTALRRRGVPARLAIFPNENHWILSAPGKRAWWGEVSRWLGEHLN